MKRVSNVVWALILGAVVTAGVFGISGLPVFRNAEYTTLDGRFQLRRELWPGRPSKDLVLVGIDGLTQEDLGTSWPFPRSYHGQLMAVMAPEKPAVVTWDILFTDPTTAEQDQALVEGAKMLPAVITGANEAGNEQGHNPPVDQLRPTMPLTKVTGDPSKLISFTRAGLPFRDADADLLNSTYFGFVDVFAAGDGRIRFMPLVVRFEDRVFASLTLETMILYAGASPDEVEVKLGEEIVIPRKDGGAYRIPIDAGGQYLIDYRYMLEDLFDPEEGVYQTVPYSRLGAMLVEKQQGKPASDLKTLPDIAGRIVLIGFTGAGFDTGTTPLGHEPVPLVVTHLNAIDNILQHSYVRPAQAWVFWLIFFLLVTALAWILLSVNFFMLAPIGLAVMAGYTAWTYGLFLFASLWVPTANPLVGIFVLSFSVAVFRYFTQEREKTRIKDAMGSYLPDSVMQMVLENPEMLRLGGQKREISVLFCDIRGFTKYCDDRDPELVVDVLNEYLEVMTEVIFRYEGTVDKYIGDCIMAFWNAPKNQLDHAQRAVCCAMEMRYALANYKVRRAGIDTEIFECGIGIHTGEALVGNVGSSRQMGYTAIGSTVNLAARLEALTKRLMVRILVSEATRSQIEGDFTVTDLGEVAVSGFARKQHVYAVEAQQVMTSALEVGKRIAAQAGYTAEEVVTPLHMPAPLPEDADVADANEDPEVWAAKLRERQQQNTPRE